MTPKSSRRRRGNPYIYYSIFSYSNEFSFSFKIDKNYFNIIQTSGDKYELRIDNRSFTNLIHEGKRFSNALERSKPVIRSGHDEARANHAKAYDDYYNKKQSSVSGISGSSSSSRPHEFESIENSYSKRNTYYNPGNVHNGNNTKNEFFNDKDFDFNSG